MKRMLVVFMLVWPLLISSACAAGFGGLGGLISTAGELPDPADQIGSKAFIYEKDVRVDGVSYIAFTFPMPQDFGAFLDRYTERAEAAGYSLARDRVLDQDAYAVASGAKAAYLVPNYRGALLFLVNSTMNYALIPTPTPTPRPTPAPTPRPAITANPEISIPNTINEGRGGGHVEYIQVKQDCFACVNGKCDLCNGSGWYRNYGVEVPCTRLCQTCNGLGYWYTTQPVWVP